ncbi:serine carboxypeptidase S28-domain-containing protein [Phellopilus nigrolimitatus]|nr:serine carboxypeptidase S28-domain-containing protein [Phellopilus nigrolimitatus]
MAFALFRLALALLVTAASAQALKRDGKSRARGPASPRFAMHHVEFDDSAMVARSNGTALPPYDTVYYFDQLIDHNNPGLGTFQQRYWHTHQWYEPGGPIVLFLPGEDNAASFTEYLTNQTFPGQIAQQQRGASVIIEHRFFGESNPYSDLSGSSLEVLTIQQSIDDLEYFAQNVQLPMPNGSNLGPDKAPWVLTGGSYGGALTAWTMVNKPGLFYAGYASSAVVQASIDFWQYFDVIRQFMPQNCSADVQAVIEHVDTTFTSGSTAEIDDLKSNFGLLNMTHLDDVAASFRNILFGWQSLAPYYGAGAEIFEFCDALEVKDNVSSGANGWGLDNALPAWGDYWKNTYVPIACKDDDVEYVDCKTSADSSLMSDRDCLGTYNPTMDRWTNTTVNNAERSWQWLVCNEMGFYQDGAPSGMPTIASRLLSPVYEERQCTFYFPDKFKTAPDPRADATNAAYGGWDLTVDQLFFANGKRDPWRDATTSTDFHARQSTSSMPIAESDGFHCNDLISSAGTLDATIRAVQQQALGAMAAWLGAWQPGNRDEHENALERREHGGSAKFVRSVMRR